MKFAHHLSALKPAPHLRWEFEQWRYMVVRIRDYLADNEPNFDRALFLKMADCTAPILTESCVRYLFEEYDTKVRGTYIGQCMCRFEVTDFDRGNFPELRNINIVYLYWDNRDEDRQPIRLTGGVPI
jgi:hypothetical protein